MYSVLAAGPGHGIFHAAAWYQLSLLSSPSDTDLKEEADGSITVHYAGLTPGSQYLLLMRKDSDKAPDPENLLYIDQLTAAEDGSLTCRFTPRVTGTGAKPMLIQALYPCYPILGLENPDGYDLFHVDGKSLESLSAGLTRKDSLILTGYRHPVSTTRTDTPADFTQYPVSMDVWMLTFQEDSNCYQAEKLTQMHDLLLLVSRSRSTAASSPEASVTLPCRMPIHSPRAANLTTTSTTSSSTATPPYNPNRDCCTVSSPGLRLAENLSVGADALHRPFRTYYEFAKKCANRFVLLRVDVGIDPYDF